MLRTPVTKILKIGSSVDIIMNRWMYFYSEGLHHSWSVAYPGGCVGVNDTNPLQISTWALWRHSFFTVYMLDICIYTGYIMHISIA